MLMTVQKDACGDTALHDTLCKKNTIIAGMLWETGKVDLTLTNKKGVTSIHLAAIIDSHE